MINRVQLSRSVRRFAAFMVLFGLALAIVLTTGDSDEKQGIPITSTKLRADDAAKEYRNINFDKIKFDMKKGDNFGCKMLTEEIEKLHGTKVRIRGFILPPNENDITEGFFLTRDNGECCFGPGAIVYDRIRVTLNEGDVVKYVVRAVAVEGTFEIKYLKDPIDDSYMAVYQLSDVHVR